MGGGVAINNRRGILFKPILTWIFLLHTHGLALQMAYRGIFNGELKLIVITLRHWRLIFLQEQILNNSFVYQISKLYQTYKVSLLTLNFCSSAFSTPFIIFFLLIQPNMLSSQPLYDTRNEYYYYNFLSHNHKKEGTFLSPYLS